MRVLSCTADTLTAILKSSTTYSDHSLAFNRALRRTKLLHFENQSVLLGHVNQGSLAMSPQKRGGASGAMLQHRPNDGLAGILWVGNRALSHRYVPLAASNLRSYWI